MRQSAQDRIVSVSDTQLIGSPSVGDVVRQGDVYLECLDDGYEGQTEILDRQLAPGTTQGSRHILEGDCTIWKANPIQESTVSGFLVGPSFRCDSDVEVTHPEHGNKILPDGTAWGALYQRVGAVERRVRD